MARLKLPVGITSPQLDDVFRTIIKLSPERERAVRLRLDGFTYKEIVEKINAERPNGLKANVMWAQRCCKRAEYKLYDFDTRRLRARMDDLKEAQDRLAQDTQGRLQDTPLPPFSQIAILAHAILLDPPDDPIGPLYMALSEGDHKMLRGPGLDHLSKKPRIEYPCPECSSTEWTHQSKNVGGHKNIRIYICESCGYAVTAADRRVPLFRVVGPHPPKSF